MKLSLKAGLATCIMLVPLCLHAQPSPLADSLSALGMDYMERGNYKQAEVYLAESVEIYRKSGIVDTSRYLDTRLEYAYALYQRARYQMALQEVRALHPLLEARSDTSRLITLNNYRGSIYKRTNDFAKSEEGYQQALKLAAARNDSLQVAIINDNLGGLHLLQSNFQKSLDHRRRALVLFEEVGTDLNLAITLNNIGLTYVKLSMYDQAYEYLSRSLELSRNLENTARLATGYGNMGMVHYNLGNYDQAMVAYQNAIEYARKAGNPVKQAHVLVNLGNLYNKLGDTEKSLDYYRESLELVVEHDITSPTELSTKYKNIGARLLDLGRYDEARENYRKALELRRKAGDIREIALSLIDMAQMERIRKQYDQAEIYARRSSSIADSTGIRDLKLQADLELGKIWQDRGELNRAIRRYRKALETSRMLPDRYLLEPLSRLAYAYHSLESDSAIYYGQRVVDVIEQRRERVGELASLKSGFFEAYVDLYIDLASWALTYRNDERRALQLVEASRARALLDELAQAAENLDQLLPVDTRLQKQQLEDRIEDLQNRIDTTANVAEKRQLRKQLRGTELEYGSFMNQVRSNNPQYKKLEYPSSLTADQMQQLVDDGTAILEYAFGREELLAFLITSDEILVERVDVAPGAADSREMTRAVERFRDHILAHQPLELLQESSGELVECLIEPFWEELRHYQNLMIVPDGVLAYLPFEALLIRDRYLVERFSVKYTPSLTIYSFLSNNDRTQAADRGELLAVAGSNFGGSSRPLNRGEAYAPLPATIAEVDSIAAKFRDVKVLKEGNFDEDFIKKNLNKPYRFIHLATHGIIDEDYPGLSGLALSSAPEYAAGREDGILRSSEIYQLNMQSEMVVLSACNTGLGKIVNGEGILGLQRAFFYAGVPTVSVSLWNVYDRSTAYFMDQFYSSLLDRLDQQDSGWQLDSLLRWLGWDSAIPYGAAAPAMREAKLGMLNHLLFHHPVYWAPFIVLGR
ncbi:MAG: CHAT domain-containing protein [Balneolaceae bacterium]|nr:CHAT domain-containing protein [Balneolaceae bacterium]